MGEGGKSLGKGQSGRRVECNWKVNWEDKGTMWEGRGREACGWGGEEGVWVGRGRGHVGGDVVKVKDSESGWRTRARGGGLGSRL